MINFGTQYYRPPFPNQRYWEDDFKRIRDSGLNCVQLWLLWSWIEAKPKKFIFDDYDRLADLAEKTGLNLVLSTIAEVQPYWIEREVPDCALVTNMGQKVVSSNRNEIHFGITPGGCFDHPEVHRMMMSFIRKTVSHFKDRRNIAGWDCWNEIRWNVQADGFVCYCPHTLAAYRSWLEERHGSLEELNKAWQRRYSSWLDVVPGKTPPRPYTDMMAFQHFLTERTNRHAAERYRLIKSLDGDRPVTIHGPCPCFNMTGDPHMEQPLNRGNDWTLADSLDGVGCSNFPMWWNMPMSDYAMSMSQIASAARNKLFWISELQGGRVGMGFDSYEPVPPEKQQKWVWEGVAHGASTILFWCWRDEVFGGESSGFGIIGSDGLAARRLDGIGSTAGVMKKHSAILAKYKMDKPEVGLFFSPQSYYLHWSHEKTADRALAGMRGYFKALVVNNIPCRFVEEEHLGEMKGLKVLFMPRANVLDSSTSDRLISFVKDGGTLFCECETGAWDSTGIYRYPEERFASKSDGTVEIGRRPIEGRTIKAHFNGLKFRLRPSQWLCPWIAAGKTRTIARHTDGSAVIAEYNLGKGRIILCGSYLGNEYDRKRYDDFEDFLLAIISSSGLHREFRVHEKRSGDFNDFTHVVAGSSSGRKVVFVFIPDGRDSAEIVFDMDFFQSEKLKDLMTGDKLHLRRSGKGHARLKLSRGAFGIRIVMES